MGFSVLSVGHTGITVSDLERSLSFWTGGLGFEVAFRLRVDGVFAETVTGVPGAELERAMVSGYGHMIELLQYVNPDDRSEFRPRSCDVGSWHLALIVDDIDAAVDTLRAHGFDALSKPVVIPVGPRPGGRAVYTRDPDGVTVELIQRPDD